MYFLSMIVAGVILTFLLRKASSFGEIWDQEIPTQENKVDPRFSWPEFRIYEQPSKKAPSYFSYNDQYYHVKPPTKEELDETIRRVTHFG